MTVAVILIVFLCSFIIVHHLYKIKDNLEEELKERQEYFKIMYGFNPEEE